VSSGNTSLHWRDLKGISGKRSSLPWRASSSWCKMHSTFLAMKLCYSTSGLTDSRMPQDDGSFVCFLGCQVQQFTLVSFSLYFYLFIC
jgi:hypothetical protein